jgi:hypothetical protein
VILDHRGVIERAQEITARLELAQETLVIDIKAERFGRGVEVSTINEQAES